MPAASIRTHLESLLHADGFGHTLPSRILLGAPRERVPFGVPPIDDRLGGGLPVGALAQVVGPPSSGRTGAVCSLLATATARGELVAYIDAADTLDPSSAARHGVALSALLWVRCGGRGETAFKVADAVVRVGGWRVAVLDLGDIPTRLLAKMPSSVYRRLQRAVELAPTALVLLADEPVAGPAAAVTLRFEQAGGVWRGAHPAGRLLTGLGGALTASGRDVREGRSCPNGMPA